MSRKVAASSVAVILHGYYLSWQPLAVYLGTTGPRCTLDNGAGAAAGERHLHYGEVVTYRLAGSPSPLEHATTARGAPTKLSGRHGRAHGGGAGLTSQLPV